MKRAPAPVTRYAAPRASARLVLAHGAGAGQGHPLIVLWARGLAARGVDVCTFDFPYMARGTRRPDARATLEACWVAVAEALRPRRGAYVLAGKSMGARMASYVLASGAVRASGLVCFGYPLHPVGTPFPRARGARPPAERAAHLRALGAPALFVQGTRDELGTAAEVARAIRGAADASVYVVPGGDHSLRVRKRDGDQAALDAAMLDAVAAFVLAR